MTYRGKVKDGVVVLDEPAALPDGTEVSVRALKGARGPVRRKGSAPTLLDELEPFIGMAEGLPPDASANVDHYLYGAPKQR